MTPWLKWLVLDAIADKGFGLAAACAWWANRAMLEAAGERTDSWMGLAERPAGLE